MRNLLAMAAAGLLVFAGLGWYLDWYRLQTSTTPDGRRQIAVDLDTNKVRTDVNNFRKDNGGQWTPTAAPGSGGLIPAPQGFTTPSPTTQPNQQPGFSVNVRPFENGPNMQFNVDPRTFLPSAPGSNPGVLPPPR
ncbi:MAG: lactonase family protein [Gemmataceae bacterium]|nr:lactonase family protein [Gemmataceae bacterium]